MIFGLIIILAGLGLVLFGLSKTMGMDADGFKYIHWGCISHVVGNIIMAISGAFPVIFIIMALIMGFLAYKSKKLWDEAQNL